MQQSIRFIRALLFMAWAALPLPATAQALTPAEDAAIDTVVTATLARTGVPAVSVAVVRDGKLVLARAWGRASATLGPAKPDMPFQIGSNSKQFLAALILLLADEGRLSLDDKISRWMPDVTDADRITVRQLLSHTAGLQDYWPQDYSFAAMEKPVSPQAIVDRWAKKPLDFAPGTQWQYSNTGYVVAGRIAELAGRAPLAQLFAARLFGPLGIHPLFVDETIGPEFPHGHSRHALGPVHEVTPPGHGWLFAAGELSMTASDLARWDIARIDRQILPARDWAIQETPVLLRDGTTNGYGLGVSASMRNGRRVIDHGGGTVGFLSQNTVWLDNRAAVVVLTNADFSNVRNVLTDAISGVILSRAAQEQTGEAPRLADAQAELAALTAGRFAADRFTDNARSYFTPDALADYQHSLTALGACEGLAPKGKPRLRGGFVNRNFGVTCGGKALTIITYAEHGPQGRWEQFLISED